MKKLSKGIFYLALFMIWTLLVLYVDVKPIGVNNTNIGLSTINTIFFKLTGVHMTIYTITDWLGLILLFICLIYAFFGLYQLITRRSIFKVDKDIILLGVYYVIVIACYLLFEMLDINYRPILINGKMEASYPSSTTLLTISVILANIYQLKQRINNIKLQKVLIIISYIFMIFMVVGRMICGVHWLSDIIGSVLFSVGLYKIYEGINMKG